MVMQYPRKCINALGCSLDFIAFAVAHIFVFDIQISIISIGLKLLVVENIMSESEGCLRYSKLNEIRQRNFH